MCQKCSGFDLISAASQADARLKRVQDIVQKVILDPLVVEYALRKIEKRFELAKFARIAYKVYKRIAK